MGNIDAGGLEAIPDGEHELAANLERGMAAGVHERVNPEIDSWVIFYTASQPYSLGLGTARSQKVTGPSLVRLTCM